MAIYHFHTRKGSRQTGQSAAASHAYITRLGKYAKRHESPTIVESGNMPAWADDAAIYWQAADAGERANGRLFRSYEFSLPVELTKAQQEALAREFCRHVATSAEGSLPYTFAIHPGKGTNPHCHLLVSERINDGYDRSPETWFKRASKEPERGGARKAESLEKKETLLTLREEWADMANSALSTAGHDARIDHRSFERRGIDEEPGFHVGPKVEAMARKGIDTAKKRHSDARKRRKEEEAREKEKIALEARRREEEAERLRNSMPGKMTPEEAFLYHFEACELELGGILAAEHYAICSMFNAGWTRDKIANAMWKAEPGLGYERIFEKIRDVEEEIRPPQSGYGEEEDGEEEEESYSPQPHRR